MKKPIRISRFKTPINIYEELEDAAKQVAQLIIKKVTQRNQNGRHTLLAFSGGTTPLPVFHELILAHKRQVIDFSNVYFLLTDEVLLPNDWEGSNLDYLQKHLLSPLGVLQKRILAPPSRKNLDMAIDYCNNLQSEIDALGGIDLTIMGLGKHGVVGFNEPGHSFHAPTRIIRLNPMAQPEIRERFRDKGKLPTNAISMGVDAILKSKRLVLMAWGTNKARAVSQTLQWPIKTSYPSSILMYHSKLEVFLDKLASQEFMNRNFPPQHLSPDTNRISYQ